MIKYFCDICGKELSIADRVKIPTDLDYVKTQSLIQGLALGSATSLLCFGCYTALQVRYERFLNKCKEEKMV